MIQKISEIKNKYGSYAELIKALPYLCKSASATEFKEEITKYIEGLELPVRTVLFNREEETDIPVIFLIFGGYDYLNKVDWLLSKVPKNIFQEYFFDLQHPVTKETVADYIVDTPGLQEVFEKHDFIFTAYKGMGYKTSTFEWNGFTILNAGFHPDVMGEVLEELKPVVERIKKFGFGKALYNPVVFVSSPMKGQVKNELQQKYEEVNAGGYYNIDKDHIVLRSSYWGQKNITPATFVHELGHRIYYKFLSETQRQRWQQHFRDRHIVVTEQNIRDLKKLILSCTPTIKDITGQETFPDFSRFNYTQFTNKLRKNPEVKEVLDFIVEANAENKEKNIKTKRREYFANIFDSSAPYMLGGAGKFLPLFIKALETQKLTSEVIHASRKESIPVELWEKYKIDELEYPEKEVALQFAKIEACYEISVELLRQWASGWNYFVGKTIRLPHSSSKYGGNNPHEDYAEAFMYFMLNREMPEDIYREFINLHNIRLGSKKTAKLTPEEELRVDALQKRIDTLYKKKEYEEAEELEEKLETLLFDLEAREEHYNIEHDESEDFYGYKNRLTERPSLVPDLDEEGGGPSIEEELARLYLSWIRDDDRYGFEKTNERKDYVNAHPGVQWDDIPKELTKSEDVFTEIALHMLEEANWYDKPRKDITFEEAFAAAKDAYESVKKRRDRTRNLLKKADFQKDRYYQQLAVSAYEKVVAVLKHEAEEAEKEFEAYLDRGENTPFEYFPETLTKNPHYEGFEVRAANIGVTENQYPLIFLFGTKNKIQNPALGFTKQNRAVILFNNLKEPFSLTWADTRLDKSTFIHEYIHYLDAGRGSKRNNYTLNMSETLEEKHWQKYYNNPKEMNAYYQENIPTLYKVVETMVKNNYEPLQEAMSSGYEAFFKLAIKFFNLRWWEYLTPENKKRVQKRLYQVYKDMKEKF